MRPSFNCSIFLLRRFASFRGQRSPQTRSLERVQAQTQERSLFAPKNTENIRRSARHIKGPWLTLAKSNVMCPTKPQFLSMICTVWLSIQCHSVAAGNELQTGVSAEDLILVDNPISAEQTALNEVENSVRQNPTQAPDIVAKALRTEVPHPVPFACEIVRAAIAGIGRQITRVGIARLVYAAVQASPDEALSIVGVAIEDTPPALHQDVVGAATAAVPDPYACVSPGSLQFPPCNPGPKEAPDGKSAQFSGKELEPKAVAPTPIQPEPRWRRR